MALDILNYFHIAYDACSFGPKVPALFLSSTKWVAALIVVTFTSAKNKNNNNKKYRSTINCKNTKILLFPPTFSHVIWLIFFPLLVFFFGFVFSLCWVAEAFLPYCWSNGTSPLPSLSHRLGSALRWNPSCLQICAVLHSAWWTIFHH